MSVRLAHGDCLDVMRRLAAEGVRVDSVVCDPPYGLEFMGLDWDAPWQVSSKAALFGKRQTAMPGWGVTRNPNCRGCGGRLRGAKKCACAEPDWDEAPNATKLRQMSAFQDWCQEWAELAFAILKPGGHLVAFGGTRTYHRLACAIEDAGFEIRGQLAWTYGTGFPKSQNVSKAIDKAAGASRKVIEEGPTVRRIRPGADQGKDGTWEKLEDRTYTHAKTAPATPEAAQWEGWGTALKPAWEPICLARKPLIGTVAANVLQHGTGAINIDGCRVEHAGDNDLATSLAKNPGRADKVTSGVYGADRPQQSVNPAGRWPANLIHDGSEEVLASFAAYGDRNPHDRPRANLGRRPGGFGNVGAENGEGKPNGIIHGDTGSAARFFFSAKADADDRWGSKHPTVKPIDLMRWLARLVTPPGGTVLDPFAGSGTTGVACLAEGFDAILIEREAEYVADIRARLDHYEGKGGHSMSVKNRNRKPADDSPLFGRAAE